MICSAAVLELGLVPGINADYFRPFGIYYLRNSLTLEFVDYMRAAFGGTQPFSFHGSNFHTESAELSVQPFQYRALLLWMMSRDPQTLEFCASNAINPGYFLIYPRSDAAPRYRKFLEDWNKVGWLQRPNIAYCTIVHVDETDEKAIKAGLFRAGFLPQPQPGETFDERVRTHAKKFIGRASPARPRSWRTCSIQITSWSTSWCSSAHQKRSPRKFTPPHSQDCSIPSWVSSIFLISRSAHALDPPIWGEGNSGVARYEPF